MSNKQKNLQEPLQEQVDEFMRPEYSQEEEVQSGYIAPEEQDPESVLEDQDIDSDHNIDSETEFDERQRKRELEHRSRLSSLSSGKSASSVPALSGSSKKKGVDKDSRFRTYFSS